MLLVNNKRIERGCLPGDGGTEEEGGGSMTHTLSFSPRLLFAASQTTTPFSRGGGAAALMQAGQL